MQEMSGRRYTNKSDRRELIEIQGKYGKIVRLQCFFHTEKSSISNMQKLLISTVYLQDILTGFYIRLVMFHAGF